MKEVRRYVTISQQCILQIWFDTETGKQAFFELKPVCGSWNNRMILDTSRAKPMPTAEEIVEEVLRNG